ncbi:MAG: DUF1080 domain-containing protein [Balneolaceae bacterium]|nr:DUF1080 domain-containing protein [Balneolaceae bacterium]
MNQLTIFTLGLGLLLTACGSPDPTPIEQAETMAHNTLTEQEIADGWELLFDGESMEHWRVYNQEDIPAGWVVEDGAMVFDPEQRNDQYGLDIITKETYGDFELKLEWWLSEVGNSGIFYHVIEQEDKALYWSGPEMQILDNENHPDADQGVDGNRKAGSLYDLIPAVPQNAKPYGEWNSVKIVAKGDVIEHWQNGELVLSFDRSTEEWKNLVAGSKFAPHPEFGTAAEGHIALQDHGDLVKFRNLKIRSL